MASACPVEGLFAPVARVVPDCALSASSSSEKIHFNQINKNTGHRIRMLKVDAETGDARRECRYCQRLQGRR